MTISKSRIVVARFLRRIAALIFAEPNPLEVYGDKPYSLDGWDHIPQGQYDYMPKGDYIFGPKHLFLLVPKNVYRAVLLPDQKPSAELGVGWLAVDNSPEGYDRLWGDSSNIAIYKTEGNHAREKLAVEIVEHSEPFLSDHSKICDVGCGVGDLLREIQRRRPTVDISGLDFSEKAVEGARLALPHGSFQRFVIHKTLPYETASFDAVFSTDVLEHLEYPKLIAAELVRICRPGGTVVIVVPDGTGDQFFGHNWFWNEESLSAMLSDFGAKVSTLPITRELIAVISRQSESGMQ